MTAIPTFDSHDLQQLELTTRMFSERAKFRIDLSYLLNSWSKFVHRVERGFDDTIYDYRNDLDTRDLLDEIGRVLSAEGRETLPTASCNPWMKGFLPRRSSASLPGLTQPCTGGTRGFQSGCLASCWRICGANDS